MDLRPRAEDLDRLRRDHPETGSYGTTVLLPLLPPSYTPKVMNFGGGSPATDTTEIIDLSSPRRVDAGALMSTGRIQMDAVILPNGKVLAEGSVNNEAPNGPASRRTSTIRSTNTFSSAGIASYSRLYHSAALLLPDASVMSIGSNPGHGTFTWPPSRSTRRRTCSIRPTG